MRRTEHKESKNTKPTGLSDRIAKLSADAKARVLDFIRSLESEGSIPAEEVLPELKDPAKRAAAVLRGFRAREELTQEELAAKLNMEQADISKMEKGTRAIGPVVAKRLAEVFKVDYRVFL